MTASVTPGQHVPDILDCLAQLSNERCQRRRSWRARCSTCCPERFGRTPTTGGSIRSASPAYSCVRSPRAPDGLAEWEPDFDEAARPHLPQHALRRCDHRDDRRSSRGAPSTTRATRPASTRVVRFDRRDGNLPFIPAEHTFKPGKSGRARSAGPRRSWNAAEGRENYAYAFIHGAYPTKEMTGHEVRRDRWEPAVPDRHRGLRRHGVDHLPPVRRTGDRAGPAVRRDDHAVALVPGGKGSTSSATA